MNLEQKERRDEHAVYVISPNCTGCRLCSLACSFHYTKAFSLSDARINIMGVGNTYHFMVSFTKECTKCGECAKYCYHKVLNFSKN
jgi:ferredoxin